jgi:hypothetical protein
MHPTKNRLLAKPKAVFYCLLFTFYESIVQHNTRHNQENKMQIQQQIMLELADIPEAKLFEIYDLIHYFKLGLAAERKKPTEQKTSASFFEQLQLKQEYADDNLVTLFKRDNDTGRMCEL